MVNGRWEWLGSRVVSVLDWGAVAGPGFKSQPRRCRVTVSGKLFTPIVPLFTKQRNWYRPTGREGNWWKVMAANRRVYDSRHLQADCQEPGSARELYPRQSSMGYLLASISNRPTRYEFTLLYQFLCQPVMQLCIASNNILLNLAFPFRRLWRWHYPGFRLRSTSLWGTIRAYSADCARSYRSDPFPRLWNARSAVITYEFATVLNSEQFIWAVRYTELKYSDGHFRLFCI